MLEAGGGAVLEDEELQSEDGIVVGSHGGGAVKFATPGA